MNKEGKLCPQNFQVWVAFLMGMVVIIIAIVVFDNVSVRSRLGLDTAKIAADGTVRSLGTTSVSTGSQAIVGQTVSYTKAAEDGSGAWLGIEPLDVTEAMAKQLGLKISGGVLVSRVIEGSPAEKAGLLQGDIIYEVDHQDVENSKELGQVLAGSAPGDRIRIALFRDGKRKVIYVKLGERVALNPTSSVTQIAGEVPTNLRWGIVVSEVTESLQKTYDIPGKESGVIVVMVVPGSAADKAGILKGDVIREVNGSSIDSLADFFEAIADAGDNVLLNICRQNTQFYVTIVAVSPFRTVGGSSSSEDEDSTDSDGLQGMPATIPPRGKPDAAAAQQTLGVATAQEGIGMNRPLYVPGYDQTQSGDPQSKTTSVGQSVL